MSNYQESWWIMERVAIVVYICPKHFPNARWHYLYKSPLLCQPACWFVTGTSGRFEWSSCLRLSTLNKGSKFKTKKSLTFYTSHKLHWCRRHVHNGLNPYLIYRRRPLVCIIACWHKLIVAVVIWIIPLLVSRGPDRRKSAVGTLINTKKEWNYVRLSRVLVDNGEGSNSSSHLP